MSLFPNPATSRRLVPLALAAACLALPAAADSHLNSAAGLRPLLTQARNTVAACAAAPTGCDPAAVPADATVGNDPLQPGGFAVHFDWLRTALTNASTASANERASTMKLAGDHLTALEASLDPQPGAPGAAAFDHAHATVTSVLSREEFQAADPPTAWDRFKSRLWGWIARLFEGVDELGNAAPWIPRLLEWLFFLSAAVGLVYFLQRAFTRQRLRVELGSGAAAASGWAREATSWAELARARAAEGDFREAIHCLYWSAIVLLEGRRLWRHDPSRTPREYVRLLPPGSPQREGLRDLTAALERTWYGLREATAADFATAETAFTQLAAFRPATTAPSGLTESA
jgi:hypothetical protein